MLLSQGKRREAPGCLPSRRSPLFTARDAPESKSKRFWGSVNGFIIPCLTKGRGTNGVRLINKP